MKGKKKFDVKAFKEKYGFTNHVMKHYEIYKHSFPFLNEETYKILVNSNKLDALMRG